MKVDRSPRLLLALLFAVPVFVGAVLSYLLLRGAPELYKILLLAFSAGMLVTLAIEEIVPESHKDGEARMATVSFIGGFSLFVLLAEYLR